MRSIAIVGVGLIGGSFGLGLRKAGFAGPILGVSSDRSIAKAVEAGAIDRGVTLEEAAAQADVFYLSQPISGILRTLDALAPQLRGGCLVTDAGSTKTRIVEKAKAVLPPGTFLGGHPMAGKEARGVGAADADLFRGRTYVFTPDTPEQLYTPEVSAFLEWIGKLGAQPVVLSASDHDRVVALTSHLPQLASTAIAALLAEELGDTDHLRISGSGLRDMTRLALSSYDIWGDIISSNTMFIDHVLQVYIDKLTEIRHNLQTQRLEEIFCIAAEVAGKIRR